MSVYVLHDESPVARKRHQCDLCHRVIEPGERYYRQRSIWEGGPFVHKECAHCRAMCDVLDIWGWARDMGLDDGVNDETVYDYEPNNIAEARVKVGWKWRWRHRDGSLMPIPSVADVSNLPTRAPEDRREHEERERGRGA